MGLLVRDIDGSLERLEPRPVGLSNCSAQDTHPVAGGLSK